MNITYDIQGGPGRDNAVLVRIDTGQSISRLLFDCGDGCLNSVPFSEIQAIDHLFFSHLHMDHVGGFDHFFRCVFNRDTKPNRIWGPPETARIMSHRFQGFLWNLHAEMAGTWHVTDITDETLLTTRFELAEAFTNAHQEGSQPRQACIVDGPGFTVEAYTMDHRTPTIAYVVREKPHRNIDTVRLAQLGLRPGVWMKHIKDLTDTTESVEVGGVSYSVAELRQTLLVETPGESLAYLTDFLLDEAAIDKLAGILTGCQTIVCEGQYRHSDQELARKNCHMTTVLSAQLAARAGAKKLILFHLSDRYDAKAWMEMLMEAREHFPETSYPLSWHLDLERAVE